MFIVGPLSLMEITNNWVINSIIVVFVSFVVAFTIHKLEKKLCALVNQYYLKNFHNNKE